MASTVVGQTLLNWKDLKDRMDPNGMPAYVAEVLTETNDFLEDILWKPSNQPLGHTSTVRTGLPAIGRRRLNRGTTSSKSTVTKVEDSLTMIEGFSTVDVKALQLYGGEVSARKSEARAFAESMAQQAADDFIYATVLDSPDEFDGLMTRFNSLSGNISRQVLDAGGTGADLSSIYLVGWGDEKVYGLYPKNTQAGLQHEDWGKQLIQQDDDIGGQKLPAYVDQWSWDYGLCVKDYRFVVRIANIEPSEVLEVTGTQGLADYGTGLPFLLARAMHHIWNINACMPRFYAPRAIIEGLDVQWLARTTDNAFQTEQVDGKQVLSYRNIPIRTMDALTDTESAVT